MAIFHKKPKVTDIAELAELKRMKRSRRKSRLLIASGITFLVLAALLIAASAVFRFDKWRSFDSSLILDCDRSVSIYDRNGELICIASGGEKRIWVNIAQTPKHVINAFVAAEDARFFTHDGIDVYRIFGAAWADIKAGGYVQGASTISQQLIKLSHLSAEKTLDRKLEEAALAMTLESHYDKNQIMEMYLNYVYFGGGYYGIEAASRGYFGIPCSELTVSQAAQLAGILKSPSKYAPHLDMEASRGRRDVILGLMRDYGYLDEAEYNTAIAEECLLNSNFPTQRSTFIDYALSEACALTKLSMEELLVSGVSIYTTLDSQINAECLSLINDDSNYPSDNAQCAITALDKTGGIVAMVGGRGEYNALSLNRAADMERQPGSLIKPILVYAPALDKYGYTAATLVDDTQKSFGNYTPRNSDDKYYGVVTLRTAVTKSLNIPAVDVLANIGLPSAVMFAKSMGISFEREELGLSLALGGFTHGVSPLEMAGAYCAFSRGGVYTEPTSISAIISENGEFIYERALSGKRVMSEANAYILTSMLQSVAREGTGRRLAETGLPIAAKTGTAVDQNGVRDAWCAVYSTDYTAVVWMGTDSAVGGSLPTEAVGGNHTTLILAKLFEEIYRTVPCNDFEQPSNVSIYHLDSRSIAEGGSALLATALTPESYTYSEYFTDGTAPIDINNYWTLPVPPSEIGWSISESGQPVISFIAEDPLMTYTVTRIDANGNNVVIAEFVKSSGYLSCRDGNALRGAVYTYYVTAIHPELLIDGVPASSEPSRRVRVVVPFS